MIHSCFVIKRYCSTFQDIFVSEKIASTRIRLLIDKLSPSKSLVNGFTDTTKPVMGAEMQAHRGQHNSFTDRTVWLYQHLVRTTLCSLFQLYPVHSTLLGNVADLSEDSKSELHAFYCHFYAHVYENIRDKISLPHFVLFFR